MLDIVADVALRPTLPDGTLGAVRDFLVRQIRNRGEKPYDVASDQTRLALFGPRHPYCVGLPRPQRGRAEAESRHPDGLVPPPVRPLADGAGGQRRREERRGDAAPCSGCSARMPAGKAEAPTVPAPPAMAATREVFKVPGAQAQIFMSTLAPALTHPDYPVSR